MTFFPPLAGTCFAGKEIFFCFVLGGVGDFGCLIRGVSRLRVAFFIIFTRFFTTIKDMPIYQKLSPSG